MKSATPLIQSDNTVWWVWWDHLLEDWFYTDIDPETSPGLVAQLRKENVVIHPVQAASGFEAIEQIQPNHRARAGQIAGNLKSRQLN